MLRNKGATMNETKKKTSDEIDSLWVNVHLATMTQNNPYGMVENGALAVSGAGPEFLVSPDSIRPYPGVGKWVRIPPPYGE